jgi:hypothetical protein
MDVESTGRAARDGAAGAVLAVQRSAGNQATVQWLARARTLRRQPTQQAVPEGPWWAEKSGSVHAAIGAGKFLDYPDGAFWIINPLNGDDRAKVMTFLDARDLVGLIDHGPDAVKAGVPNANDIVAKATEARSKRAAPAPGEAGATTKAQRAATEAIPDTEIRAKWAGQKAAFLDVASDPANELGGRQMYQIWLRYWMDRHAEVAPEVKRLEADLRQQDLLGFLDKRQKFDHGKRGVLPPEYEAAADREAAAKYYTSCLREVHDWLEVYVDTMHKHVTLQRVNEQTVELIKQKELHMEVLGFVLALADAPVREPLAPPRPRSAPGEAGGRVPPGSVGPMARYKYEGNPKHPKWTADGPTGVRASKAPKNGQDALDCSVQIKDSSPRRVGIDYETSEFAIFDEHTPGNYHGHVRTWDELEQQHQNALVRAGMTDRKGRILRD